MPYITLEQLQIIQAALREDASAAEREAASARLSQLAQAPPVSDVPIIQAFTTPPEELGLEEARAALEATQRLMRHSSLGLVGARMPPWSGVIALVNQTAALLLGGSQAALRGQLLTDIFVWSEEELAEAVQTASDQGRSVYLELRRRDEGAAVRWCGCNVHAIHRGGALVGAMVAMRDITMQLELARRLREGERLLEAIEQASLLPLCILDERGAHTMVNDAYCALVGWRREELLGKRYHVVVPPGLHQEIGAAYRGVLDGVPTRGDWELTRRGGQRFEANIKSARYIDERGQRMLVCSVQDMAEQRRREELQEHLDTRIAQHQKLESLGLLAGGIAHDFHNILAGVQANLELLVEANAGERAEIVEDMRDAGQRAAALIRTLTTYAGQRAATRRPHDLGRLVEETVRLLWTALRRAQTCAVRLPDGPLVAELDPSQLQQVIINLILNAQEASEEVEWPVEVQLEQRRLGVASGLVDMISGRAVEPGLYAAVRVRDWGVGMSAEQQARVFDPFYTTKGVGRGLGLAGAAGIIRAHSGAITLHSAPGRGSTFEVLLPIVSPVSAREDR